jgi:hypothetical protein
MIAVIFEVMPKSNHNDNQPYTKRKKLQPHIIIISNQVVKSKGNYSKLIIKLK